MTRQSADWNKTLFHWKAGLAYQIVNQPQSSVSLIKPFFNVSQGKIAPDIFRLSSAATNKLEPETIFMIDAGIQMSFLQEKIELTPTFFHHNIKDRVVYISRAPFITANTDQKSTGIELETKVFVGYGFSLQGSYTYQDFSPPKTGPQSIEAQRLPENMFKTSLNWNGWQPLNVNVAFVSVGQRNYSTDPKNLKYLPSYELLNLAISYQVIQELKLFVRVNNLLDQKYYSYRFDKVDSYRFNLWGGLKFQFGL